MKTKQIMTTTTGLFENIDNIIPLPDDWNGLRWLLFKEVGSKDQKSVNDVCKSYKTYGILCAFDSVVLPHTFDAILDGKKTKFKKGMRLLLDENRRYKAVTVILDDGCEIITPTGEKNVLPINDLTETINNTLGEIKNMETDGKEKIFKILMILNFGQEEFSDESIIIGGAECVLDKDEKKKFIYLKNRLKTYCTTGDLTVKLALKAILGRDKLNNTEKEKICIKYDMNNTDISDLHLKAALKIKRKMGGQAPAPFINVLFGEIYQWLNTKYFLGQEKTSSVTVDKNGNQILKWNIIGISVTRDCFPLPDTKDINLYKEYLNSIVDYITITWKKEIGKDKLSGEPAVAKREIQKRVEDMWEEYKS